MDQGEVEAADVGGPRAWIVLLVTAAVAALVIGGIVGYQAWRDDDDDAAEPVTSPASTDVATTAAAGDPSENQLFRRTTAEGIEVRVRLTDMRGGRMIVVDDVVAPTIAVPEGEPSAARPEWCNVVGDLMAWAIGPDSVVQGGAPWTEAVPDGLYPGLMWDGSVGVDSVLGVVLQVGADVESVRLTGPGGAADEMEPVNGAVVLAVPVPGDVDFNPWDGRLGGLQEAGVAVVASRADGTSVRASPDAMMQGHPAWNDPRCVGDMREPEMPVAPSTLPLPSPGSEQPADPAAARGEIEATFASLYGPSNPDGDRLIDDTYGLDVARQQVDANGFGDDAEAATVEIHDLVFATATDAVFVYTLTTPVADFADQIGRARFIDGVWKITRATLCQDMAKAGAMCPP